MASRPILFHPILFSKGPDPASLDMPSEGPPPGRVTDLGIPYWAWTGNLWKLLCFHIHFPFAFWHVASSPANGTAFKYLRMGLCFSKPLVLLLPPCSGRVFPLLWNLRLLSRRHPQPQGGLELLKQNCNNKERIVQLLCFKNRPLKPIAETIVTKEKMKKIRAFLEKRLIFLFRFLFQKVKF